MQWINSFLQNRVFNTFQSTWVTIALLASFSTSISAYFIKPVAFSETVWLCYLVASIAIVTSFAGIIPFALNEIGRKKLFVCLFIQAGTLVLTFAGIYRGFGLENKASATWDTALYFSIVTWTTLGYGDVSPSTEIRLIAASEAALGYVFLGLIIALIGSDLSERNH